MRTSIALMATVRITSTALIRDGVAIMNVTFDQQNLTARQLLKSKRHLWMRVGKYKIVLHGYGGGEEKLYWCVQIINKNNDTDIYHIVGEHSDNWHTGWSKFTSVGDAINNALSAIVEIEGKKEKV